MTAPIWKTPKNLGIIADGVPFEKQLSVSNLPNENLLYNVIAGDLPAGLTLTDAGKLYGVPAVVSTGQKEINYKTNFTVRVLNQDGQIADRTFNLTVSGVLPAIIDSDSSFLGTFHDGEYCKIELTAKDTGFSSNLNWIFIRGRLPPGISFNSNGVLEGFFYQNRVPNSAFSNLGWDKTAWDEFIYDYIKQKHNSLYEFTVELTDGINSSRQTFIMEVIARIFLTADGTTVKVDTEKLFADYSRRHLPFISTRPQILPEIKPSVSRQNTNFAFKFDAVGIGQFNLVKNYNIKFEITSLDNKGWDQFGDNDDHVYGVGFDSEEFDGSEHLLPPNLGLDEDTGWYVGKVSSQIEYYKKYEFYVFARPELETNLLEYDGYKSKFGLHILGPPEESISWHSDSLLGNITNGSPIEIQLNATHSSNKALEFSLVGNGRRTPQGIVVLKNGVISGRASIEYFTLDNNLTKLDDGKTTVDRKYTFTVKAYTNNKSAYSEKEFTLIVDYQNKVPFNNLYLKAFPSAKQRELFESIINDPNIFPNELIYRPGDPDFGKANDIRFLFLPGINAVSSDIYYDAVQQNHYTKTLIFGDIKTAIALDENSNIQYEVVYVDVIDQGEERDLITGEVKRSSRSIDLTNINKNFYVDKGVTYRTLTPNSLDNMRNRIESIIGYANKNTLPLWMTSPQLDPTNTSQYTTPLGLIPAAVIAHTKPGASNLIAYRLKNANFNFNQIEFKFDRYQLDSHLSTNFDTELKKFNTGTETTFDVVPSIAEKFRTIGTVDYAVSVNYNEVVGQPVANLKINADLSPLDNIQDGDTLIFFKRGVFPSSVPGRIDQLLIPGVENVQASIFTITIQSGLITLSLKRLCNPGDIISVVKSKSFKNKQIYLESYYKYDIVPHWWILTKPLIDDMFNQTSDKLINPHNTTTFDNGATRFFNNRTYYSNLDPVAKYIKFPKNGVFT